MTSLLLEPKETCALDVRVTDDFLVVSLSDGRVLEVPLGWYPRLKHATMIERGDWRLTGGGLGIHWPALDEDISVENILAGKPSSESQRSLQNWLAGRQIAIRQTRDQS